MARRFGATHTVIAGRDDAGPAAGGGPGTGDWRGGGAWTGVRVAPRWPALCGVAALVRAHGGPGDSAERHRAAVTVDMELFEWDKIT